MKGRRLEFADGVPFILLGTAVYDCQQGKDRNTALKMRTKKEKEKVKHACTKTTDKYFFYVCVISDIYLYMSMYIIYLFFQLQLEDHGTGIKRYKIRNQRKSWTVQLR